MPFLALKCLLQTRLITDKYFAFQYGNSPYFLLIVHRLASTLGVGLVHLYLLMNRSVFSGLRFRLLALMFLALVPVVGLTLYAAGEVRRLQANQVQENLLQLARLAANEQKRLIEGTHYLLIAMARLPEVRDGDTTACNALLTDLLQQYPDYTGIGVADQDGDLVCSGLPLSQPVNVADRLYFRRVIQTGAFVVGEYLIGRASGKAGLGIGYPVLDQGGQIKAVVIAALDLAWLNRIVSESDLPTGGTVTVWDSQGVILIRYPDPDQWVGQSVPEASVFQAINQQGGEGTTEAAGADGAVRLYGFTPLTDFPEGNAYIAIGAPPEVAYAGINRTLLFSLGGIGLVAIFALAAAYLVAEQFILRDVQRLLQATQRLTAGELQSRSGSPYGRGELGQLARAFDDMAATLEARDQERTQAEAALLEERALLARRVAERTADLSAANAEMVRAAQLKDEFLANMSHELRTPLNAILGLSEAMEEGVYGPLNEKQSKSLRTVQESGRHLLELINDILDVSKIEAGKLVLEISPVSLEDVCQASLQFVRPAAQRKQQTISYTFDGGLTAILADERRLKQILVNLLSNAVKFTPEGGRIGLEVAGDSQQQVIRLTVWDSGIGIAAADLSRLFQPFVQLDSRLSRHHTGTGLGLTLAYRMSEMHGGSLSVTSEEGQGSRFTVTLPWRRATGDEVNGGRASDRQPNLTPLTSPATTRQALVIEDSTTTAEQLARYLQELGIQVAVHNQAEGAIEKTLAIRPDFIILDILLPEPSGWDVLRQLKADPHTQAIPVIVVSVIDERPHGTALGAAAYLVKPVSRQQLIHAVAAAMPQWVAATPASESKPPPSAVQQATANSNQPVILLAEDNEFNIQIMTDYLLAKGFQVTIARNGEEAIARADDLRPDLILMDIQMPGMDGLEATRRMRSDPWLKTVPIIALTALAMPGDRERCLAAGANDYMSKPITLSGLQSTIEEYLNGKPAPNTFHPDRG